MKISVIITLSLSLFALNANANTATATRTSLTKPKINTSGATTSSVGTSASRSAQQAGQTLQNATDAISGAAGRLKGKQIKVDVNDLPGVSAAGAAASTNAFSSPKPGTPADKSAIQTKLWDIAQKGNKRLKKIYKILMKSELNPGQVRTMGNVVSTLYATCVATGDGICDLSETDAALEEHNIDPQGVNDCDFPASPSPAG